MKSDLFKGSLSPLGFNNIFYLVWWFGVVVLPPRHAPSFGQSFQRELESIRVQQLFDLVWWFGVVVLPPRHALFFGHEERSFQNFSKEA